MIAAADFFTEVKLRGLKRFLVLFFIELSTRTVRMASIARQANGLWKSEVALELTEALRSPNLNTSAARRSRQAPLSYAVPQMSPITR